MTRISIRANWTTNGNPSGTQYLCQNVTTKTDSGWITDTSWVSDNLACGISYSFRVKAKNQDGVETGWTSLGKQSCVHLLEPNGGEMIPSGSDYDIPWEATPLAESFDLYYSLDSGASWTLIKRDVRNTIYPWPVPKTIGNKKACLVKVVGYNAARTKKIGSDASDKPFTIEVVKIVQPNGGEVLKSGDPYSIQWEINGTKSPVTKVNLYYTTNKGESYVLIENISTVDPGTRPWAMSHQWTPTVTSTKPYCKVKGVLYDVKNTILSSDVSDNYFTISP